MLGWFHPPVVVVWRWGAPPGTVSLSGVQPYLTRNSFSKTARWRDMEVSPGRWVKRAACAGWKDSGICLGTRLCKNSSHLFAHTLHKVA